MAMLPALNGLLCMCRCLVSLPMLGSALARGAARRQPRHVVRRVFSQTSTRPPAPDMQGMGKTNLGGIFDYSLKQHYMRNKPAVDRIALSFLAFYISGQIYVQKAKRDQAEAQLMDSKQKLQALQAAVRDEKWIKDVASRLNVSAESLSAELSRRVRQQMNELDAEELAEPTVDTSASIGAAKKGATIF